MKKLHKLVALALFTASAAASAQGYGLVSVGSSKLSADCSGTTSCETRGTGWKLMGGWKFMPMLAAEVGYFDYGKAKFSAGGISGEIADTAIGAGLAFHQSLATDWVLAARLGLARVKTKVSGSVSGIGSASDTSTNTAAYGGVSVGYMLAKNISLDGVWDFGRSKYNNNGANTSGSINVFSVGLTFGF